MNYKAIGWFASSVWLIGLALLCWFHGWETAIAVALVVYGQALFILSKEAPGDELESRLLMQTASVTSRLANLVVGSGAAAVGGGHANGDEQVEADQRPDEGVDAARPLKQLPE